MPRQPNGHSTTYFSKYDKLWHTWVHVGTKPNGKEDRRNVRGKTATESADKADALRERMKRGGNVPTKIETVEQWLTYWVHKVAREELEWKTFQGYEIMVRLHVIPHIGAWKLEGFSNRLEPEHVRAMYAALKRKLAPSYVRQVHWMLKSAMQQAVAEGKAGRNVCDLVKPPSGSGKRKIKAHNLQEVQAIVQAAMEDPLAERWLLGMLLGPRQGEVLAIRWNRLHLDDEHPYLEIEEQLQRRTWEHGCDDPVACVKKLDAAKKRKRPLCRRTPCPPKYAHGCPDEETCKKLARFCPDRKTVVGECARHLSASNTKKVKCPPLCAADCDKHASLCPDKVNGGIVFKGVKSESGERILPLFPILVELFRLRREDHIRRDVWTENGLVFRGPTGEAIDPRRDHDAWEKLLVAAKVADSRLHAARHTAGSLLVSKADIAVVQEILGHADIRMTKRYIDVAKEIKQNAINDLAAAIFAGDLASLLQPKAATKPITTQ